jgi:3-deoxy-D-manno-octulosonate 8-phosphate phosphatase KdsC-like HAD superfamily phosphatase
MLGWLRCVGDGGAIDGMHTFGASAPLKMTIQPARQQARAGEVPVRAVSHCREQVATIGDMPNDVLMFGRSGLSIALGQSDREVQRAARRVTRSNEDEGFAEAVERFIFRINDRAALTAERS